MPVESTNTEEYREQPVVESERGALFAVLVMVVLGLAGIFAVS